MRGLRYLVLLVSVLFLSLTAYADAEGQQQSQPQMDLSTLLFFENPELNLSLGLEKTKGEVYLIIEMDHNPTRNEFVLRFDTAVPQANVQMLQRENSTFGFKNKLVLNLPLIELQNPNPQAAKFVLDAPNYRTSQRINITKLIEVLAKETKLFDEVGNLYRSDEVKDISLLTRKAFVEKGNGHIVNRIAFNLDRLESEKVTQILGEQPLSDVLDYKRFKEGSLVQLRPGYKLPHRSSESQWVALPEKSTSEYITYKLVPNPKLGQRFVVKKGMELSERVLPKIAEGERWVKQKENTKEVVYVLQKEAAGLSDATLLRYVVNLGFTLGQSTPETALPNLVEALKIMPVEIEESRLEALASKIVKAKNPEQVLGLIQKEQELSLQAKMEKVTPSTSAVKRSCSKFLF